MLTLIALPDNFVGGITSTTGQLFADFSSPIQLVLGVLLLATVIGLLIGALRHH